MSLGKTIGETMVSAVRSWNPFGPAAYERRDLNKAYRKARKKAKRGETLTEDEFELLQTYKERPMAIDIGTRTSTNAAVGGGTLGLVYVNLIEMLPYPQLVAALTTPEMVVLASVLLAGVIARFSKTPAQPKAL